MSLLTAHFPSPTLAKQVAATILLPDWATPPFATLYLLHGLSDDHSAWTRYTRLESHHRASRLPLIIVMPDGYRGFYTDNADGPPYAQYLTTDVLNYVDKFLPTKPSRDSRAVAGLSMGGYGALRLALGFPDLFASATSHSGALLHGQRPAPPEKTTLAPREFRQIFGDANGPGSPHDLTHLAKRAKSLGKLPKLMIDCGTEDFLIDDNRQFHAQLESNQIPHTYEEHQGSHNWDYWDAHVQHALQFDARALRLTPVS